jgi:hypothetical protein
MAIMMKETVANNRPHQMAPFTLAALVNTPPIDDPRIVGGLQVPCFREVVLLERIRHRRPNISTMSQA